MTDQQTVTALKRAAAKYEKAEKARQAAMAELRDSILMADAAGVARNEIQRLTGVARVTLYRILGSRS